VEELVHLKILQKEWLEVQAEVHRPLHLAVQELRAKETMVVPAVVEVITVAAVVLALLAEVVLLLVGQVVMEQQLL
jgi:hypothetical protein